jgi:hypothetical protein
MIVMFLSVLRHLKIQKPTSQQLREKNNKIHADILELCLILNPNVTYQWKRTRINKLILQIFVRTSYIYQCNHIVTKFKVILSNNLKKYQGKCPDSKCGYKKITLFVLC